MRGTVRWTRADLRAHRGQSALTVAVVAGVVAALVLATMLLEGALNPWQELFARTRGADMLVYLADGTPVRELRALPGVRAVAAPYDAAPATLVQGAQKSQVELRGMGPSPPAMSAPFVVAGSWLRAGSPDGVVVEASFAAATHVGVGDRIVLDGVDGTTVAMRVIGIADTADQGFYPQWTPGLIWAGRTLLSRVEPAPSETTEVVGLRLADPSAAGTGQVSQEVFDAYNGASESSPVERIITRQQVMESMASDDRLLGLLLALFGIIALVAAPCAIANVTSGRVLMQRQDIAMLKALGFTPGQVVRMLIAEQTALGVAGPGGGDPGHAGAAAWLLDGADRRRNHPHRGDRHGHPGMAGGEDVTGRGRPAEPAGRPPLPGRQAVPARPAAGRPRPRRARRADQAAARRAHRGGRRHPDGDDHDRARLLGDERRLHVRPGPDRPGRRADRVPRRAERRADDRPDRTGRRGRRLLPRRPVRHAEEHTSELQSHS